MARMHFDHRRNARDRLRRGRSAAQGRRQGGDHRHDADGVVKAEHALSAIGGGQVDGIVCDVRDAASVRARGRDGRSRDSAASMCSSTAPALASACRSRTCRTTNGIASSAPISPACSTAARPRFRICKTRGGGWIVNISSLASTNPFPGGAAYCASKAGLNAFSDALMQELRYDNIRVTTVLPGSVATGFSGREPGTGADWKLLPEDVAQAIVDLLIIRRAACRAESKYDRRDRRSPEVLRRFCDRSTIVLRSESGARTAADCALVDASVGWPPIVFNTSFNALTSSISSPPIADVSRQPRLALGREDRRSLRDVAVHDPAGMQLGDAVGQFADDLSGATRMARLAAE